MMQYGIFKYGTPFSKLGEKLSAKPVLNNIIRKAKERGVLKLFSDPDTYHNGIRSLMQIGYNTLAEGAKGAAQGALLSLSGEATQAMEENKPLFSTESDHNLWTSMKDNIVSMALLSAAPHLAGGILHAKGVSNDIAFNGLWEGASHADYYKPLLSKKLADGDITQDQYNKATSALSFAQAAYKDVPELNAKGKPLSDDAKRVVFINNWRKAHEQLGETERTPAAVKDAINKKVEAADKASAKAMGHPVEGKVYTTHGMGITEEESKTLPPEEVEVNGKEQKEKQTVETPKQSSENTISMFRHGETNANVSGLPNEDNEPLNETGIGQAKELGKTFKERGITHIISDGTTRTKQTSSIAAKEGGILEDNISTNDNLLPKSEYESDRDFAERIASEKKKLARKDKNTAIVTHGEVLSMMKALDDAHGDIDKAIDIYHKNGEQFGNTDEYQIENVRKPKKTKGGQDAIQEQSPAESMLRNERIPRQSELSGVEQSNQSEEAATEDKEKKPPEKVGEGLYVTRDKDGKISHVINNGKLADRSNPSFLMSVLPKILKGVNWDYGKKADLKDVSKNAPLHDVLKATIEESENPKEIARTYLEADKAMRPYVDRDVSDALNDSGSTDPYLRALQYFADGGKVYKGDIDKLFGNKGRKKIGKQRFAMSALTTDDPSKSLERISEDIYRDYGEDENGERIGSDFKEYQNELENVATSIGGKTDATEKLKEAFYPDYKDLSSVKDLANAKFDMLTGLPLTDESARAIEGEEEQPTEESTASEEVPFQVNIDKGFAPAKEKGFRRILKAIQATFPNLMGIHILKGENFKKAAEDAKNGKFMYEYDKGNPSETLDEAKKLFKQGVDPDEIEQRTGWLMGLDKKWKSWIPNSDEATAHVSKDDINNNIGDINNLIISWHQLSEGKKTPLTEKLLSLDDVLDFPGFVKNHPYVDKNTKIAFFEENNNAQGITLTNSNRSDSTKIIGINIVPIRFLDERGKNENIRRTILHELQHVLQPDEKDKELGGNPDYILNHLLHDHTPIYEETYPGHFEPLNVDYNDRNALNKVANRLYRDSHNEIEARASGKGEHLNDFIRQEYGNHYWNIKEYNQTGNIILRLRKRGTKFLSDSNGTIYGFVHDGRMYLNGDKLNYNTPIHEAAHLFTSWAKDNAPELHRAGLDLTEGSPYLIAVQHSDFYKKQAEKMKKDGASDKDVADFYKEEALAKAVGDQGEKMQSSVKERFKNWLNNLWNTVKRKLGKGTSLENKTAKEISNMTLGDFSKQTASRILSGKPLEGSEGESESNPVIYDPDGAISDLKMYQNAHPDEDVTKGIVTAALFSDDPKSLKDWLDKVWDKTIGPAYEKGLRSSGVFGQKMREDIDRARGEHRKIIQNGLTVSKRYGKALKKFPEDKRHAIDLLTNQYMETDPKNAEVMLKRLPEAIRPIAKAFKSFDMQNQQFEIDQGFLSTEGTVQLKDGKVVLDEEGNPIKTISQLDAFRKMYGKYFAHVYRVEYDPKWKYEDLSPQDQRRLYDSFKTSILENHPELYNDIPKLDTQIKNEINRVINEAKEQVKKNKTKGYKHREIMSDPYKLARGWIDDTETRMRETTMRQGRQIGDAYFQKEILDRGLGKLLFKKGEITPPGTYWELGSDIFGGRMNGLIGLRTDEKTYRALKAYLQGDWVNKFYEGMKGKSNAFWRLFNSSYGAIKMSQTALNIHGQFRNFLGRGMIAFANGNFLNSHMGLDMHKSFLAVKNQLQFENDERSDQLMNEAIERGIINHGTNFGALMEMFDMTILGDKVDIAKSKFNKLSQNTVGKASLLYGASDDFWNVYNYTSEKNKYSKALFGKPVSELTDEENNKVADIAAEITKNTQPTYSRVYPIVRFLNLNPLMGNFLAYRAENYRITANTISQGIKEMRDENPAVKKIGALRLGGMFSYLGAKIGAEYGAYLLAKNAVHASIGGLTGTIFSNEAEKQRAKDLNNMVAPWFKNQDKTFYNVSPGVYRYQVSSYFDPYGDVQGALNALFEPDHTDAQKLYTVPAQVGMDLLDLSFPLQVANSLATGFDQEGRPIYYPDDLAGEKATKSLEFALSNVEPSTIKSFIKNWSNKEGTTVAGNEIRGTFGLPYYYIDVNRDFKYRAHDIIKNIKEDYYRMGKKGENPEKIQNTINRDTQQLQDLYNTSIRLGGDQNEIENYLYHSGLKEDDRYKVFGN